jgi:8-oxo-dGTP pyrophosphatase MutT (NUDIX family)
VPLVDDGEVEAMRIRPTVRVVLLDPLDRVMLFRYVDDRVRDPADAGWRPGRSFWATCGGGIEGDETPLEAARRELREETGLTDVAIGREVLHREKLALISGEEVLFREVYLLGRTRVTDVSWAGSEEEALDVLREARWWTLAELRATDETVFPEGFVDLLAKITGGTAVP